MIALCYGEHVFMDVCIMCKIFLSRAPELSGLLIWPRSYFGSRQRRMVSVIAMDHHVYGHTHEYMS